MRVKYAPVVESNELMFSATLDGRDTCPAQRTQLSGRDSASECRVMDGNQRDRLAFDRSA
jgi:hypothetical protein